MTRLMLSAAAAALLAACLPQAEDEAAETGTHETGTMQEAAPAEGAASDETAMAEADADAIGALLAGAQLVDIIEHERREADRARDEFRNPMETIAFFGLQPDMTVAEALPGGGWYTRVILPYVAAEGRYVALNYQEAVFERLYGERWTEETQAQIRAWPETAPEALAAHGPATTEAIDAYMLDAIPDEENGEADAVLFIRALHHLNRFDPAYMQEALAEVYDFLRPGGIVGVVQHRAPEDMAADMTTGSRGYLKQSDVIAAFEQAGFVLEETSEINANPADTADWEQGVWGLPPSNAGDTEDEDVAPSRSIGESDRMTLRFRKPE
ncbi:hypothetical protein E5163_00765 [Marinicauda algicola]|uniref:Methyltransferase n=1 Tax=Marinicauda algicola TaxID=2029849 RepID=A0A4S2H285_9PROT|nr:class I SAM-dependent methyltransferase [Marinicauda algicola]TGY89705.1 hypothetical protein E5163_00765 [Marinicauda algicola]